MGGIALVNRWQIGERVNSLLPLTESKKASRSRVLVGVDSGGKGETAGVRGGARGAPRALNSIYMRHHKSLGDELSSRLRVCCSLLARPLDCAYPIVTPSQSLTQARGHLPS